MFDCVSVIFVKERTLISPQGEKRQRKARGSLEHRSASFKTGSREHSLMFYNKTECICRLLATAKAWDVFSNVSVPERPDSLSLL